MKAHHSPTLSEIILRLKLNWGDKHKEETMADFVAEFCALDKFSNYAETLNSMLKDLLVCEVSDEHIQQSLLVVGNLTLQSPH